MAQLKLSRPGEVAIVDDEVYGIVSRRRWYSVRNGSNTYVQTRIGTGHVYLHTYITGYPKVDHINHDGLDNRRANLRVATQSQNAANRRPLPDTSSKYKGVSWYKAGLKWRAYIKENGRQHHLGYFWKEEDAARAYDLNAIMYFGEYANTNFPRGEYDSAVRLV